MKYPFKLDNALFAKLEFERQPQMSEQFEIQVGVQIKVVDRDFPEKLEVHLKIQTDEDSPLRISMITIGLFSLVKGESEPERSIIPDFVSDRAFYILWAHVDQIITHTTAKMGIDPIRLQWPVNFLYEPSPELI
jgi:preprotein translocase subunit SecB